VIIKTVKYNERKEGSGPGRDFNGSPVKRSRMGLTASGANCPRGKKIYTGK